MSDLISREELKKAAKRIESMPWGDEDGNPVEFRWSPEELEALIDKAPSAEPERKTGQWIEENPQNSTKCRLIKCSECGDTYIVNMNIDYADWIEERNFCRRCGADLRGAKMEGE